MGATTSAGCELRVPDIGDAKDVAVIELLVQVGDTVRAGQNLLVIETDKATMEVPAEQAGVIRELRIGVGGSVSRGSLIAVLEPAGAAAAPHPAAEMLAAPPRKLPAPPVTPSPEPLPAAVGAERGGLAHASPSVRKLAREFGVTLDRVAGSGAKGRITAEDLRAYLRQLAAAAATTGREAAPAAGAAAFAGLPPWPRPDFAQFGTTERVALSRIRRLGGAALHRNWLSIPHVTNHEDADVTELEAFRLQLNREHRTAGVKFSLLAFVIKACVAALQRFPEFNASLNGEQLVLKRYWHIGFAVDTPNGLVVPVIRDAERKGLVEIARESAALAARARASRLAPADLSGGSFSISSLGAIGGSHFTPIINAPEVAILGIGRSRTQVGWSGDRALPRLMLPLSLSWDHRVIDGAAAARFNACLAQLLADFRRALL